MPDKTPSALSRFGWRRLFSWLNVRFARKQDRLTAGAGIILKNNTVATAVPMVPIKNSAMIELIKTRSWQPGTLYLCVNDEDSSGWTFFFNGGEMGAFPDAWYDYLAGDSK